VYQVLWTRLFSHILGGTYLTISLVVASFMSGLFLGAWLIGKYIYFIEKKIVNFSSFPSSLTVNSNIKFDNSKRYLRKLGILPDTKDTWLRYSTRLYGILEGLIGIYAICFILNFSTIENIYQTFHYSCENTTVGLTIMQTVFLFILLAVPTFSMGASLPLIVHAYTKKVEDFGANISWFYASNTLGGAFGGLIAGFILLEFLGITNSLYLMAIANLLIGGVSIIASRRFPDETYIQILPLRDNMPFRPFATSFPTISIGVFAFLTGFAALASEMIWTRALRIVIHSSTYSFSIILFIFLLGITIGSLIANQWLKSPDTLALRFGISQCILGLFTLLSAYLLYVTFQTDWFQTNILTYLYDYAYNWGISIVLFILLSCLLFLIPTIMMGIAFPLLNSFYYPRKSEAVGAVIGEIYTINTIGSILGALGAGLVLIPLCGMKIGLLIVGCINLWIGSRFFAISQYKGWKGWSILGLAVGLAILVGYSSNELSGKGEATSKTVFYKEGLAATVKVFDQGDERYLSIDGISIASSHKSLLQKEKLVAHLPFLIRPTIKEALSVGLASGISTGSISLHPSVETVECVELVDAVFPAATYFEAYHHNALKHPKIQLFQNDIYNHLTYSSKQYDLISSDGKLGSLNNANTVLLSKNYYDLCQSKLSQQGLFIQWIPLITPHSAFKTILQTLSSSFPYVYAFYFYPSDVLLVGTNQPIELNLFQMQALFDSPTIASDLKSIQLDKAGDVLGAYIGRIEIDEGKGIKLNSFDQPILEFRYLRDWKRSKDIEGGYRAQNLTFLLSNYQRTRADMLDIIRGLPNPDYLPALFNSSANYYQFCIDNFKRGNYQQGVEETYKFRTSLPF